jgi:hypothetical protein
MKSGYTSFFCSLILFTSFSCFSQIGSKANKTYSDSTISFVEIVGFGSTTSRTPFWIQANQFGVVPRTSPVGSIRAGFEKFWNVSNANSTNRPWRVGIGIEGVGNLAKDNSKLLLPQVHGTLRFKNWELFAGRKKQVFGLADSSLGTGSYIGSGNAIPIPRIQIGTLGYVNVPLTNGWLSFLASYSDGYFENNRPVTGNLKLHQKQFYLRIGKVGSKLKLYGGVNHAVQWGGNSPYFTLNGKMPNGFSNYLKAVISKRFPTGNDLDEFDSANRVGNHLGSIDAALEINTYGTSWFIYRQNVYEDGSLFHLTSLQDGLNGIRFRKKNSYGAGFEITEGLVEFLFTKSQGGKNWVYGNGKLSGRDNYFNNGQVRDGWSYYNRTIGTPFITPTTDTEWKYPKFADSFTSNNRVAVYHMGLKGTLARKILWTTKLSYSSNIGTYDAPFPAKPTQFSGLLTMQGKINIFGGTILKGSVAADMGELYPDTYGFSLGLRKEGLLSR